MKQFYLHHFFLTSIFQKPFKTLLFSFLLLPLISLAQFQWQWDKVYDRPTANASVAVGNDQNPVFFSVNTLNTGYQAPQLFKLDGQGGKIWESQLPDGGFMHRLDLQGNSYVLGTNTITKVNVSGQLVWTHDLTQYNLQPETFELDDFGSAYIAGFTGNAEIGVLKVNSANDKLWLQKLPFDNKPTNSRNLVLTLGNAIYVGGTELGPQDVQQTTFFKLNEHDGAEVFKRTLAEQGSRHTLKDLQWHDSKELYVFMDEGALTHGHTSQLIHRYDFNGNLIWQENFLFESRDYYTDATLDVDGNILLLTNEQLSGSGANFGFGITKISPDGETTWHHTYRAPSGNSSSGTGVALLSNGNIAIVGNTSDENDRQIVLMHLYSPTGNFITESIYPPPFALDAVSLDLAPDDLGNLYVVGRYSDYLATIKYSDSNPCTEPEVIVKSDVIDCVTNTAQLQAATNATGASFSWAGPEGYTSNEQNPVVTVPGDYTLTITTGTNCAANATVTVLPANTTSACYTIDFENETTGLLSHTQTKSGTVAITGMNRWGSGFAPENHAAIFESGMPTGDDDDLYTDDWGKVLIINETLHGEPNDNRTGGILLLDFSTFGPVTMESLKVLDIDTYENDSWVVLYDRNENELFRKQLQPLGDNSRQTADLGNTPNVMRVRVLLGGTEGDVGSGAVDDIKFCIEKEACEETTTATAYAAPTLFSDKTTIVYKPTRTETYEANLYDLQGNLVCQLARGNATAGELQQIEVQAGNLKNGLYIARIITGSGSQTVKLILQN